MRTYIIIFLLSIAFNVAADELKPFTSDGCSAFPDGTFEQSQLWLSCCTAHDLAYWQGGTSNERLVADEALQQCVAKVGEPEIAQLMLAGVRVGGTPYLPTPFRWGYGWSYPRGYKALTMDEKQQVTKLKASSPLLNKSLLNEKGTSK
ncbi:hypothetical protein [Litorilituus lipolyticus]|uniref:FAD-binding oxidoreductase n=1 Tax=Litorilituus lipolyticus TaxID=2491017 RepID=A0A502KTP4_9GAMM|nr:hypothetical protein [Litorilituus lipolyticus]TPH13451.1 hypothetical protein EPA86_14785 [Litorilituus lipolyticus]